MSFSKSISTLLISTSVFLTIYLPSVNATESTKNSYQTTLSNIPKSNQHVQAVDLVVDGIKWILPDVTTRMQYYTENIWYANLYPWVKEKIDNKWSDPRTRRYEYKKICWVIAQNKGLAEGDSEATARRIVYGNSYFIARNLAFLVREENGVVSCHQRKLRWTPESAF